MSRGAQPDCFSGPESFASWPLSSRAVGPPLMSAVVRQVGFGNEMGKCNTHPRCATRYKLSARHGYLAGRRQARLDYQKEARLAVAQLAKSIGVAVHTISWFTWKAKHRGSLLAKKDAEDYDNAMKEIF